MQNYLYKTSDGYAAGRVIQAGMYFPNYSTENPVREALFREFLAQKKTFGPTQGNVFVPIRYLVYVW
jgi:hypothetical protein